MRTCHIAVVLIAQILGGGAVPRAKVRAQEPLELPRLTAPIRLDGLPDDIAWQAIPLLPVVQYLPTNGAAPTQRTELRIAYDDDALFVAGTFHDRGPPHVGSLARDNLDGSDVFRLLLDTFRDNENAVVFGTNPAAVRWDATIGNDGEWRGMPPVNTSWNSFWDVRTRQSTSGWSMEMRVPFSALRFELREGRALMGVSAYRTVARTGEMVVFPAFPVGISQGQNRASSARTVSLALAPRARPLQLSPYVLGGFHRSFTQAHAGGPFDAARSTTREAGFDAKYALTNMLTLDLTVNTDFAQADSDDQQVNLTRFSLFQPEKRQFFQERAGIFEFGTGDQSRVFHSRRIGLDDVGAPVPIVAGTRAVGRIAGVDAGAIAMHTAAAGTTPAETFGVLRARRNAINPYSYFGGIVTTRIDGQGALRLTAGADATVRIAGNDHVDVRAVTTTPQTKGVLDNSLLRLEWARRTEKALSFSTEARWVGSSYDPALGFTPRSGFLYLRNWTSYGILPEGGPIRRIGPGFFASAHLGSRDASVESAYGRAFLPMDLRAGGFAWLGVNIERDRVTESFTLSDDVTEVPAGLYRFGGIDFGLEMPASRALRMNVNGTATSYYDGRKLSLTVAPKWNMSQYLELGGEYQVNRIRFAARNQLFRGDVARLRLGLALNTALSGSATVQYNQAAGLALGNARVRYNFGEGRDLFLVYLHTRDTHALEPAPRTPERTLLVKYTYTFLK